MHTQTQSRNTDAREEIEGVFQADLPRDYDELYSL